MAVRAAAAALALSCAASAWAQDEAADPQRVIGALGLRPGSVLAEIGAGDGGLTLPLARHVGAEGRVFTTELGDARLAALRAAIAAARLPQVQVVDAHPERTNLADACCDAIVMRDVYHHFADPAVMNASLFASLKPGGRLAVLDFGPSASESDSAAGRARDGQHGVGRESVARELRAAGFTAVSSEPIAGRRFIVVAHRP
jgi:predicted methyltransferase